MKRLLYDINRKNRGRLAREYLQDVFNNPNHPMYAASDVVLADKCNVTRLTIINIRKGLDLKNRNQRVIDLLHCVNTNRYTIAELAAKFGLKYQNTYKLLKKHRLQTRPDKPPIDSMLEYLGRKKKSTQNLMVKFYGNR
jgi:hypothetical protein